MALNADGRISRREFAKHTGRLTAVSALAAPLTALRALDGFGSPVLLRDVQVRVDKVGVFQLRRGTDDPIHILRWREPHMWAALEERLRLRPSADLARHVREEVLWLRSRLRDAG